MNGFIDLGFFREHLIAISKIISIKDHGKYREIICVGGYCYSTELTIEQIKKEIETNE